MGVSRDCPNFWVPLLSQQRVKLRTSNFVVTFIGSTGTKVHENIGNSGRGRSQGVPKIFRAPICRAHCAVIFAIAQLSCFKCRCKKRKKSRFWIFKKNVKKTYSRTMPGTRYESFVPHILCAPLPPNPDQAAQ